MIQEKSTDKTHIFLSHICMKTFLKKNQSFLRRNLKLNKILSCNSGNTGSTLTFRNIMNFYWNSYHFQRQQKSKVHWHRWYWCPAHISSLLTQLSTSSTCIFTSISWGQKCQGISSKSNPQQMIDRNNLQISQSLGESNTEMCTSHWLTFLQEDQVQPPQWWMA